MIDRAAVVAEARRWLRTPYAHQQHLRGVGCDCGGLIGGVAVALGLVAPDWWDTAFAPHAGYNSQAQGDSLLRVLDAFMPRIDGAAAAPGDVVALRFRRDAQHLGFVADHPHGGLSLVHALNAGSVHAVVEHRLDAAWRARVLCAYTLPGVH